MQHKLLSDLQFCLLYSKLAIRVVEAQTVDEFLLAKMHDTERIKNNLMKQSPHNNTAYFVINIL